MPIKFAMRRCMLSVIGAALLVTPAVLTQLGVSNVLRTTSGASPMVGMYGWLSLSISAGAYLINWSPALLGALFIYFANWRRG